MHRVSSSVISHHLCIIQLSSKSGQKLIILANINFSGKSLFYGCTISMLRVITHYYDYLFQWAYGVTCWEIFSGGKTPYPGIIPMDLPYQLKTGLRMDKPLNAACSDDM